LDGYDTVGPSSEPSSLPSSEPISVPSSVPVSAPTGEPSSAPTAAPSGSVSGDGGDGLDSGSGFDTVAPIMDLSSSPTS
jgi:hypothetical protein